MNEIPRSYRSLSRGLILSLTIFTLTGCTRTVISVEQVKQMIQDQAPPGCDKLQVQSFVDNLQVDSLKVIRGGFYKVNKRKRPSGLWDSEEELVALWDRIEEMIGARIVDAKVGFMNHNDIVIEFAVGKEGEMIGYSVMMMGTE
jgi:hypothetical protein